MGLRKRIRGIVRRTRERLAGELRIDAPQGKAARIGFGAQAAQVGFGHDRIHAHQNLSLAHLFPLANQDFLDHAGHLAVTGDRRNQRRITTPEGRRVGAAGWEFVHVAVDDHIRIAYGEIIAGRGYYGSPPAHDDLHEWEEHVSHKRMTRPIQEERLKARVRKRYKRTTMSELDQPIAANLLQQEFTAERPNQRSVGDTSELRIGHSHPPRITKMSSQPSLL